ncbi:O-succinylbenzoic acid--CoA ligase [Pseudonocardia ammonioxydans]|uniref:O-succinylbenzoic acid--CoA ligase n=1 Tax=Pseudonocardia ammonioxydans TaxID=260086 RepID=A0A1I4RZI4_PSUAM|nr:O-succinylbenzoic acid--CoA ligase [Pseudonocardia ammonioxydans]
MDVQVVGVDGSPESVARLAAALRSALDGAGPAVLPVRARPGDEPPLPEPVARAAGAGALPDGLAVVVATSGSTGQPKHVALTGDALRASAAATRDRIGGPGTWLLALPAEHVAGVQVVLRALLAGTECVVQDVRDGFRPDGLVRATGRMPHGARRYTSLVPTQLARVLDHGSAPLHALAGYDAVLIGGGALDPGLRTRAEDAGVRVVATYGMSETCGGCVYDGVPLDGVRATIEPGSGRVVLGGPVVAAGYLGAPAATAEAFTADGFRTSDLGELGPDGSLTVLGRADDVVNTGGEKVAPAAVERALLSVPGVRGACVVGIPDDEWGQVVAALVVTGTDAPADPVLRSAVRDACGRAAVPRLLHRADAVPEHGIGKPDRVAVAALLAGLR